MSRLSGIGVSALLHAAAATVSAQSTWEVAAPALKFLSGEEAKQHVVEVSRFCRENATPGFHQAALYISSQARQHGLSEVGIETFPTDGYSPLITVTGSCRGTASSSRPPCRWHRLDPHQF